MASAELENLVAMLQANQPDHEQTVDEMRASFEMLATLFPLAADVHTESVRVGAVPGEWVVVPGAVNGLILPHTPSP